MSEAAKAWLKAGDKGSYYKQAALLDRLPKKKVTGHVTPLKNLLVRILPAAAIQCYSNTWTALRSLH